MIYFVKKTETKHTMLRVELKTIVIADGFHA